jgi:DNA-binding MurR/RpiR family transcriptional regulator
MRMRECESLSPSEAQVRDFILNNVKDAKSMSIYELAKAAFVSPSTVTRLCKKLGISSYANLRLLVAEESNKLEKEYELDNAALPVEKNDSYEAMLQRITANTILTIEETRALMDKQTLDRVASLIDSSPILDFYGVGASMLVAMDAHSKFSRIGKCCILNQLYDRQYVQALNSDDSHLALIFSYSGETAEMKKIARTLREKNVPMVSFTKSDRNTVNRIADHKLFVTSRETSHRLGAMTSRTSMLYVVDALYAYCVMRDYDHSTDKINRTVLG